MTVFLTNIDRDFAAFNRVYAEYFETLQSRPTRTTVGVVALPVPISVELKIIAEAGLSGNGDSARPIDLRLAGGANDAHGHRAQAVEEPPVSDRHPFVEEDLRGRHIATQPPSAGSRMIPAALPRARPSRSIPTKRHARNAADKRAVRLIRKSSRGAA